MEVGRGGGLPASGKSTGNQLHFIKGLLATIASYSWVIFRPAYDMKNSLVVRRARVKKSVRWRE